MWNGTKRMAEKIAEGIQSVDDEVVVKLYNVSKHDENDLATQVFKSKAIAVGSPTVSNSMLRSLMGFIHYLEELKFKNKKAAAFGCYGWSGESPKKLYEILEKAGFAMIAEPLRVNWQLTAETEDQALALGRALAKGE